MAFSRSISTANTSKTALQLEEKAVSAAQELSPLSHLAFAFLAVFVPLLAIPLILCAYISQGWSGYWGIDLASSSDSCYELPGHGHISDSSFYTQIALNYVVLTSSWLSSVAQFATAPFLFLFSFLVASRLSPHGELSSDTRPFRTAETYETTSPIRRLLRGTPIVVWRWLKDFILNRRNARGSTVRFTALGSILCLVLR
jgi:hypothetical protein